MSASLIVLLGPVSLLWAQGLEEFSFTKTSSQRDRSAARQEMIGEATRDAALTMIEHILGEERLQQQRRVIEERILPNTSRYVVLTRPGALRAVPQGFEMPIDIRISRANIESLLLEQGLLYRMDGPATLLPMVAVVDRVQGEAFHWWNQEPAPRDTLAVEVLRVFHADLREQLRSIGFLALDPLGGKLYEANPKAFRGLDQPPTEDYLFLSRFHNSQLVLRGQIVVRALRERSETYQVDFRISALHANNARLVAEVVRSFQTESGPFPQILKRGLQEMVSGVNRDLTQQVGEAWRSGTFGANLVQLSFLGSMSPQDVANLKENLLGRVRDLKTMRERRFEPNRITFEADTPLSPEQLAQVLRQQNLPQFQLEVVEVGDQGLVLQARPRRG